MVKFAAAYMKTSLDFLLLLRPKRFVVALGEERGKGYLDPHSYLLGSVLVGAFTLLLLVLVLEGRSEPTTGDQMRALLLSAGTAGLSGVAIIVIAKCAAFGLAVPAPTSKLVDAFCYASVILPASVSGNALAIQKLVESPGAVPHYTAALGFLPLIFLAYFAVAAGRFLRLRPPFHWRFQLFIWIAFIALQVAIAPPVVALLRAESSPQAAGSEQPDTNLHSAAPKDLGFTGESWSGCGRATLFGTVIPNGAKASMWFQWGPDSSMDYSTPRQFTRDSGRFQEDLEHLPSAQTFYWRAMVSTAHGVVGGDIGSFTTDACPQP